MAVKSEALALAAKINKQFGEGTVVVGTDMKVARRFTTGSLSTDIALGGGLPGNQWVEVIGMESHGKTAFVLKCIAANQALDPDFTVAWVAAEHYDVDQAAALGVDNDRVIVIPTQEMEFAYQTMLEFAESRAVDMVVLDSYPALSPDEEVTKTMEDLQVGLGARLTGKFFRKAGKATRRSLTDPEDRPMVGIIINQFRDDIGGFAPRGTPKTTPGGKAKNFAFYVRIEVKRDEFIKEKRPGKGEVVVGQTIKLKTIKNKSAAPQQVASVDFYFRDAPFLGFCRGDYDEAKEIVTMAVLFDVIRRRGAYFDFGTTTWKGKDEMVARIREDLDLRKVLWDAVLEAAQHIDEAREITEEDIAAAETAGERKVTRGRRKKEA